MGRAGWTNGMRHGHAVLKRLRMATCPRPHAGNVVHKWRQRSNAQTLMKGSVWRYIILVHHLRHVDVCGQSTATGAPRPAQGLAKCRSGLGLTTAHGQREDGHGRWIEPRGRAKPSTSALALTLTLILTLTLTLTLTLILTPTLTLTADPNPDPNHNPGPSPGPSPNPNPNRTHELLEVDAAASVQIERSEERVGVLGRDLGYRVTDRVTVTVRAGVGVGVGGSEGGVCVLVRDRARVGQALLAYVRMHACTHACMYVCVYACMYACTSYVCMYETELVSVKPCWHIAIRSSILLRSTLPLSSHLCRDAHPQCTGTSEGRTEQNAAGSM